MIEPARIARFLIALAICVAVLLWAWAGVPAIIFGLLSAASMFWLYRVAIFTGTWRGWLKAKLRQWGTDLRQLGLWASLAFQRRRSAEGTAAMSHQHQFLQGRIMSPMNVFTVLPLVLALGGTAFGAFNGWRVDRLERQRDAPCSDRELSKNGDGEYRTTREACAALGETQDVARQWRTVALQTEARRMRDIARVTLETETQIRLAAENNRRRQATAARQRRVENEGIASALGGIAPDLERSLCELAGNVGCDGAEPGPPAADPAATGSVSN